MRRSLARNDDAATAVEFALIAPLIVFGVIEIAQAGLYVAFAVNVDALAVAAARKIMVGGLTSDASSASGLRTTVICPGMPFGACSRIVVSLEIATPGTTSGGYLAFVKSDLSGLISVDIDKTTSYCLGGPSTYQYLQVFYPVPVFSPLWKATVTTKYQGSQAAIARGAAAFRNEPYTTSSATTSC